MELQTSFVVPTDIDTAWRSMQDVEGLAPCMPGATLESHEGDEFTGNVKVKLGPVSMVFGGVARFVSKDEATHTLVIEGSGKDSRGGGTAKGQVTAILVAEAPDRTRVDVNTDLTITGKAAQFGRGVMQDVAGRIVDQFAGNLATLLAAGAAAEAGSTAEAAEGGTTHAAPPPTVHADESIDLLGTAGAPVLKRAIPVVIGVLVVVGVIVLIARRRKH
jgi:carbon monoxide dehydrogenase subunit G